MSTSTLTPAPAGVVWTAAHPPMRAAAARPAGRQRLPSHGLVATLVSVAIWATVWLLASVLVPALTLGWRPVVITSGSMAPGIRPGDVVLVDPGAPPGVGRVVTARTGDGLVTHRVVGVTPDGWRTRGDANAVDDSTPRRPADVVGTGRLLVPVVGLPLVWVRHLTGFAPGASRASLTAVTVDDGNAFAITTIAPPTNVGLSFTCGLLGVLGDGITVAWLSSSSPEVTGYRVERSTDGGSTWTTRATVGAATTSYDDGASLATTYDYRIVALTGTSFTATSATSSITTPLLCL